jgi:hypothetical protein
MGVKMIFTLDNHLNQGIKGKVVGPLLNVSDTTYTRFTFSGSGLVPLWIAAQPVVDPGV